MKRRPTPPPPGAPADRAGPLDPAAARLGARIVWITLAALALTRAVFAFAHSTWGWGLDAQRFIAPLPGWTLWALGALALVPAFARPLAPGVERLGDAIARAPLASALAWGAAAGLLAWSLPDRLHFLGDFQLRLTALETEGMTIARWSHVALPLDVLLHDWLVRGFHAALGLAWSDATRLLGALEAAALGALATRFAIALDLRGPAAFAASAIVLFGGYLTLYTGFDKAFMETTLCTAAVATAGLTLIRHGRGLWPLGLFAAAAFASHRSGLALLVPIVAAYGLAWRGKAPAPAWRRPATLAAIVVPFAGLAATAPGMLAAMQRYDHPVFWPGGAARGLWAPALAPLHLVDLANLTVQLTPLAIAIPALWLAGRARREREGLLLLATLLPNAVLMLFVHARQGMFRDLDCFAAAGVALAMLAAWLVARVIASAPGRAWLAVAVTLGVAAPALQWLWLPTDLERGLARARAFVEEPPRRTASVRAETWDFVGIRSYKLERWREGAQAFERAAETAPSARILTQWALCAANLRDFAKSEEVYRRVTKVDSTSEIAWHGLMGSAFQLRHLAEARSAARKVLEMAPGDPDALRVLAIIHRAERADSAQTGAGDTTRRPARAERLDATAREARARETRAP